MNSAVPSMLGMRNSRTRQKFDFNTRHNFNCHGLTFAQGQFAISNDQVARILEDDYTRVDIASGATPQAADVVIYFDSREITPENPRGIVHSATVSITDGTLSGTMVSGLGGINTESRTTPISGQGLLFVGPTITTEIYRRNGNDPLEPNGEQRTGIAANARKPDNSVITTEPASIQTLISPRPLVPLPPRPKQPE